MATAQTTKATKPAKHNGQAAATPAADLTARLQALEHKVQTLGAAVQHLVNGEGWKIGSDPAEPPF